MLWCFFAILSPRNPSRGGCTKANWSKPAKHLFFGHLYGTIKFCVDVNRFWSCSTFVSVAVYIYHICLHAEGPRFPNKYLKKLVFFLFVYGHFSRCNFACGSISWDRRLLLLWPAWDDLIDSGCSSFHVNTNSDAGKSGTEGELWWAFYSIIPAVRSPWFHNYSSQEKLVISHFVTLLFSQLKNLIISFPSHQNYFSQKLITPFPHRISVCSCHLFRKIKYCLKKS